MSTDRRRRAAEAGLIVLLMFVLLIFAGRKKGYFIDEIYSFGLSNGYYKPFITSYDVFDHWITGDEFTDYLTVQPGEGFAYGSVYYNQTQDVHPPLYYMLLHTVSSFTPGRFGVWQGLLVNLVFYAGCLWLIGAVVKLLMKSDGCAAAAMLLWGLSPGGISTGVYIRMYMLMTFFTMASLYIQVKMLLDRQTAGRLALLAAATFLGLLSQYYFVFFAFFFSGFYVLWKLFERKWKQAAVYAVTMFGAVGAMVVCFPACITHLTRPDNFVAEETSRNLTSFAAVPVNLVAFVSNINTDFLGGWIRGAAVFACAAVCAGLAYRIWRGRKRRKAAPGAGEIPLGVAPAGNMKGGADVSGTALAGNVKIEANVSGAARQRPAADESGAPARRTVSRETVTACGLTMACGMSFLSILVAAVVPGSRYLYNLYPIIVILGVWWTVLAVDWCAGRGRTAAGVKIFLVICMGLLYLSGYRRGCVQYLYPENEERVRLAAEHSDDYCLYLTNYENAPLTQDLIELSGYRGVCILPREKIGQLKEFLAEKGDPDEIAVYIDTSEFWSSGYDPQEILDEIKKETGYTESRFLYENEVSQAFLLE